MRSGKTVFETVGGTPLLRLPAIGRGLKRRISVRADRVEGEVIFTLVNRKIVDSALSRRAQALLARRRVEGILIQDEHFNRKAVRKELVELARYADLIVGQSSDAASALNVKMRDHVFRSVDRQLFVNDIAL